MLLGGIVGYFDAADNGTSVSTRASGQVPCYGVSLNTTPDATDIGT